MADRVFAGVTLIIALAYTIVAFTVIKAPFQYDPLGPETWPRILGVLATLCCLYLLVRPDIARFSADAPTLLRLGAVAVLLLAYGRLYEPAGFLVSSWAFATVLACMLGARLPRAILFGAVTGTVGYFVCTRLLELNLPAGIIEPLL